MERLIPLVSDTVMQLILKVVRRLFEFSHAPEAFTAVFTAASSVMVQVRLAFVPLIVGCSVVTLTVGNGTVM